MDEKIREEKQTNSLKVTKTTKGYTWEIKVYEDDSKKQLEHIVTLDAQLQQKFGVIE